MGLFEVNRKYKVVAKRFLHFWPVVWTGLRTNMVRNLKATNLAELPVYGVCFVTSAITVFRIIY